MRRISQSTLLLSMLSLLAACGGENKQAQPTNETAPPTAEAPSPVSARPATFGQCMMCHSDVQGRNGIGPSLFAVVGRKAGTLPSYSYSPAMKSETVTWDEATIDRFIQNPREMVPGTKMTFVGLKDPDKRAEVTHYLATLK
jgi:cytochrome c